MKYTTLGKTGERVSRLGMGCMRLPVKGDSGQVDRDAAAELIRRAFDGGIRIFDSHPGYCGGDSEPAVADGLAGVPRDRYILQTKTPIYKAPEPGDDFESRLDASLQRLRTDHIDNYLYHSTAVTHIEANGDAAWKAMERGLGDGRIGHLGLSTHDTPENAHRLIDMGIFDMILMQYNLIDQTYAPCFAYARERGLGTMVMGPAGGGRLALPGDLARLVPGATSSPEAAFRFVWSNPDIDMAFSGMSTLDQLADNLRIVDTAEPLTNDERQALADEIDRRLERLDLYCTGCNYCMPCPNGVNIPNCFQFLTWLKAYGLEASARRAYQGLIDKGADASQCEACGECEDKCPQHISIREQLERTHRVFVEGDPTH